jgi:hypothetical protein
LSLKKGDELDYGEVTSPCLYESIRHAAIIYSAAVTFPIPASTGIFQRLASLLENVLEELKLDPCWQLCPKVLLWVLVLGGIASSDTVHRSWYVQHLVAVSDTLNLLMWDEVVGELANYLWLESACDTGGRLLWQDVSNGRLLQA